MTSSSMHIPGSCIWLYTMSACHLLAQARPHDVVHLTNTNTCEYKWRYGSGGKVCVRVGRYGRGGEGLGTSGEVW